MDHHLTNIPSAFNQPCSIEWQITLLHIFFLCTLRWMTKSQHQAQPLVACLLLMQQQLMLPKEQTQSSLISSSVAPSPRCHSQNLVPPKHHYDICSYLLNQDLLDALVYQDAVYTTYDRPAISAFFCDAPHAYLAAWRSLSSFFACTAALSQLSCYSISTMRSLSMHGQECL